MVKFAEFTPAEKLAVAAIVARAKAMDPPLSKRRLTMDLAATHATCPLQLDDLAQADRADFAHDIFGIIANMDRETGQPTDFFRPRFAVQQ